MAHNAHVRQLIDENKRMSDALVRIGLDLQDALDCLALAQAEINNLRNWQDAHRKEVMYGSHRDTAH